ncbi:MAG: serpin family protein [Simkaniaceae bacterium]
MKKILFLLFVSVQFGCFSAAPKDSLAKSLSSFATQSFYIAYTNQDNMTYCPLSLYTTLLMVYLGSKNTTQKEIMSSLHLGLSKPEVLTSYASLMKSSEESHPSNNTDKRKKKDKNKGYKFINANSMWVANAFPVLQSYRNMIEESFHSQIFSVNFQTPSAVLSQINNWAKSQTEGKISNVLSSEDLNPLIRMLLLNAVYFKGAWKKPFNEKKTAPDDFYIEPDISNVSVKVDMMSQTGSFQYLENDNFQAVSLELEKKIKQNNVSCLFFLPKKEQGNPYKEIMNYFNNSKEDLFSLIKNMKPDYGQIKLPKFSVSNRIYFNDVLRSLGMQQVFSQDANLSEISNKKNLHVSDVIQSALFSMDEKGIVAAAVTAASIGITSTLPEQPNFYFTANRPFVYFLIDLDKEIILFMGVYGKPQLPKQS